MSGEVHDSTGTHSAGCRREQDQTGDPGDFDTRHGTATPQSRTALNAEELEARATYEIELSRRLKKPLSMLSIGLDHGRPEAATDMDPADPVLPAFTELCSHLLRTADIIGCAEHSLLVALLPATTASGAQSAAERLRTAIAELGRTRAGNGARRVTASIGVVTTRTGVTSYRRLRSRADAKRDDARHLGGNRVHA